MNIKELFKFLSTGQPLLFGYDNSIMKIKSNVYQCIIDEDIREYSKSELNFYLSENKELFSDIVDFSMSDSDLVDFDNKKQAANFWANYFEPTPVTTVKQREIININNYVDTSLKDVSKTDISKIILSIDFNDLDLETIQALAGSYL